MMNRLFLLFVVLGLLIMGGMVSAQAQHEYVFATLEEVVNQPSSVEWHGSNLFVNDAWTVINLTGDWVGTTGPPPIK